MGEEGRGEICVDELDVMRGCIVEFVVIEETKNKIDYVTSRQAWVGVLEICRILC